MRPSQPMDMMMQFGQAMQQQYQKKDDNPKMKSDLQKGIHRNHTIDSEKDFQWYTQDVIKKRCVKVNKFTHIHQDLCSKFISEYNGQEEKNEKHLKPQRLLWMANCRYCIIGYTSARCGDINLIDAPKQKKEKYYHKLESGLGGVTIMRDGKTILCADRKGKICFLDFSIHQLIEKQNKPIIDSEIENIRCISNSPDDNIICFADDEKWLHFIDLQRVDTIDHIESIHGDEITSINWHEQKALVMTTSKDCSVKFWCPKQKLFVHSLMKHNNMVLAAKWHQNGNLFLTGGKDQVVKLFDLRKLESEIENFRFNSEIRAVAWHPFNPSIFAVGESNGTFSQMSTTESLPLDVQQRDQFAIVDLAYHPMNCWLGVLKENKQLQFYERGQQDVLITN